MEMLLWEFFEFLRFLDLSIFSLNRKKRVLLNPPTTNTLLTDSPSHRIVATYPPTHRPLNHRLTHWSSLTYIRIEDQIFNISAERVP